MPDQEKKVWEFTCPECKEKVVYDPNDALIIASGAARRRVDTKPAYVYLSCANHHVRRYNLKETNQDGPGQRQ